MIRFDLITAIGKSLAYAAVFNSELTFNQAKQYLLFDNVFTDQEFNQAWNWWKNKYPKWFYTSGQTKKKQLRAEQIGQVVKVVRWWSWLPSLEAVYLTGSIAIGNVNRQDDYDFWIVTKPGTLWSTRLLILITGLIQGSLRRYYNLPTESQGKWCLNMWTDLDRVDFFASQPNLFIARELVQAQPILLARPSVHVSVLRANSWLKKWTLVGWQTQTKRTTWPVARLSLLALGWQAPVVLLLRILNPLAYSLQKKYMRGHLPVGKIDSGYAFFHVPNQKNNFLSRYTEKWCKLEPYVPTQ